MSNGSELIVEFVLEKLESEPVEKRARLYRALASIVPTSAEKKSLEALATECNAVEIAHAQAKFNFKHRSRR